MSSRTRGGAGIGGGWMAKKTRGQDDDQIECDAAQAKFDRQNERRLKQGKQPLKKKKKATPKAAAKNKKTTTSTMAASSNKRKRSTKYEDDDNYTDDEVYDVDDEVEEQDDFIADEEEDEEEDFNSDELPDDDDDEESFHDDDQTSDDDGEKDKELEAALRDDDDSDDDDEEGGMSFLGNTGPASRKSRPSDVLRHNTAKMSKIHRSSLSQQKLNHDQAKKRRRPSTESLQDLPNGLATTTSATAKKNKNGPPAKQASSRHKLEAVAKREAADGIDNSDDDEVEIIDSPESRGHNTPKNANRRWQQQQHSKKTKGGSSGGNYDDEDDNDDVLSDKQSQVNRSPYFKYYGTHDEEEEEDTPVQVSRHRKKAPVSTNVFVNDDDDDDDDRDYTSYPSKKPVMREGGRPSADTADDEGVKVAMKPSQREATSRSNVFSNNHLLDDSDDDDDGFHNEDLMVAKKASLKTLTKKTKRQEKTVSKRGNDFGGEENPLELLDDSSDDDDDVDNSGEYVSKEQKAALEILKTAEQLSAQVFSAMKGWTTQTDSSEKALQGIITDGAVTLGSVDAAAIAQDHEWITSETMRKVCPEVKLADYQLVGVNWMSLLNGMSCEVGTRGNTKTTKVNGVLADEMGLVRTEWSVFWEELFLCCDDTRHAIWLQLFTQLCLTTLILIVNIIAGQDCSDHFIPSLP
jgi:hypothetical protein